MKKALLATAALLTGVGVAQAQDAAFSVTGDGRFGLQYNESANPAVAETQLEYRLRFNLNAKVESDAGVTFGGRIRIQDSSSSNGDLTGAYVYAETGGFRVEVGEANGALDSSGLHGASDVGGGYGASDVGGGYAGFGVGGNGSVYGDPAGSLGDDINGVGVFAQYEVGDLVARLSYHTPDQTTTAAQNEEVSVSFDYSTGPFSISLGAASNVGFSTDDATFVGAQYAVSDAINVGILYYGTSIAGVEDKITLYGNGTFGAVGVQAYISSQDQNNAPGSEDISVGLGASYDLGGASLGGGFVSGFDGNTSARIGVSFSF